MLIYYAVRRWVDVVSIHTPTTALWNARALFPHNDCVGARITFAPSVMPGLRLNFSRMLKDGGNNEAPGVYLRERRISAHICHSGDVRPELMLVDCVGDVERNLSADYAN